MDEDPSQALARLEESTARLLATAAALTDAQVREASALPGWTRGHVLAHIARNADGLGNLLRWASTGVETPMYPSREARNADIESGSGRPAGDLLADVRASAERFAADAAALPGDVWQAMVGNPGSEFPAVVVPLLRLSEVEIHHVDLAAGYDTGDWPEGFVAQNLPRVAESFAGREDTPPCLVDPEDAGDSYRIGPDQPAGARAVTVRGSARDLLAWLTGRGGGTGLRADDASAPPVIPPWR